jgi:hypothetical protein
MIIFVNYYVGCFSFSDIIFLEEKLKAIQEVYKTLLPSELKVKRSTFRYYIDYDDYRQLLAIGET